jgi:hypothetical protein
MRAGFDAAAGSWDDSRGGYRRRCWPGRVTRDRILHRGRPQTHP